MQTILMYRNIHTYMSKSGRCQLQKETLTTLHFSSQFYPFKAKLCFSIMKVKYKDYFFGFSDFCIQYCIFFFQLTKICC